MPSLNPFRPNDEFPTGAAEWPLGLDRRGFLKVMGASLALAGAGGMGCRWQPKPWVAPVTSPEEGPPSDRTYYATAWSFEGYARGILVSTESGRPTKIEGNPAHPESAGTTDAATQAAILSLYDPDRSKAPLLRGSPASWGQFETAWLARRGEWESGRGAGLALLTEPTTSPSLVRELHRLLDKYPQARWYQHCALGRYDVGGVQPDLAASEPQVILAIESDFLHGHPAGLRYGRAYAGRRRIQQNQYSGNRLYVIEAAWSLTGGMADHRLAASPARLPHLLDIIAHRASGLAGASERELTDPAEQRFVERLCADLRRHPAAAACLAGPEQPAEVRQWARAFNQRFSSSRIAWERAPVRSDGDTRAAGQLPDLLRAIAANEIATLAVFGGNPVHTAAPALDCARHFRAVRFAIHCGLHVNETAGACQWHLPQSHPLEAWGDLRGYDGSAVLQQPLVDPLFAGRTFLSVLRQSTDGITGEDYDSVRETWRGQRADADFEPLWNRWLNRGMVDGEAAKPAPVPPPSESPVPFPALADPAMAPGKLLAVMFRPHPYLGDGSDAGNAWLQELPQPYTSLVWENAGQISASWAQEHGLKNGDVIELKVGEITLDVPIWTMPGQAPSCILLHFGGGRSAAGPVGTGRGYNAFLLQPDEPGKPVLASWKQTGRRRDLVSTQHHFSMEGRDLARILPVSALASAPAAEPLASLYPDRAQRPGPAWGMSIDLSTCLGCHACVAACQAENNIPVVGPDQVARGREMHWLRIDRYFVGEETNLRTVAQPVPCMHCENAPCELVCPVGATVHSQEGLNQMVYNRCVGTRYCSNNCPYKVRRFNFFDYRAAAGTLTQLQENPDVTVRSRGVMEKCTYCVQRISAGRIRAEKENRPIRDGEVRTACQQACPVEAIVFGDIADPRSGVSGRKAERTNYALLGELNTRPRTTYLSRVVNEAPPLSPV